MPEARLTDAHRALLHEAARDTAPCALLRAADTIAREAMGARLCTAMRFDAAAMTVRRLYSSDENAYPVGGAKPKRDTAWGRQVLIEQRLFLGEGAAAIRAHFDDHAVILGLGLRSIVNVPLVLAGTCRGTLNLLWPAPRLDPDHVALAELLGLIVTAEVALVG